MNFRNLKPPHIAVFTMLPPFISYLLSPSPSQISFPPTILEYKARPIFFLFTTKTWITPLLNSIVLHWASLPRTILARDYACINNERSFCPKLTITVTYLVFEYFCHSIQLLCVKRVHGKKFPCQK